MQAFFVAYNYTKGKHSGFGSIEIGVNSDVFVPSEMQDYIKERNAFDGVVIVNWKPLEPNQMCSELSDKLEKEEDE